MADPLAPSLELRLEADQVRRAIARLPEDQRLAVALVLVEGLSYTEAAAVMEAPVGTLTSRLGRGRDCLRHRLSKRHKVAPPAPGGAVNRSARPTAPHGER